MKPELQLNRSLSMGLLTLYGLGTTIGPGIFVLFGKVAGTGGALAPLSFVIAVSRAFPLAHTSSPVFSTMSSGADREFYGKRRFVFAAAADLPADSDYFGDARR